LWGRTESREIPESAFPATVSRAYLAAECLVYLVYPELVYLAFPVCPGSGFQVYLVFRAFQVFRDSVFPVPRACRGLQGRLVFPACRRQGMAFAAPTRNYLQLN
jgi:hypothetical protein